MFATRTHKHTKANIHYLFFSCSLQMTSKEYQPTTTKQKLSINIGRGVTNEKKSIAINKKKNQLELQRIFMANFFYCDFFLRLLHRILSLSFSPSLFIIIIDIQREKKINVFLPSLILFLEGES